MTLKEILLQHDYVLCSQIGKGGFSEVYTVQSLKYNQQTFVVKIIKIDNPDIAKITAKETETLMHLDHPNIIKLFDYFYESSKYYMVFEYCSKGSISNMIRQDTPWNSFNLVYITRQLLLALLNCHQHGIVHRDIKPENILIDEHDRPKLADFGLSTLNPTLKEHGVRGTRSYMPPEIINHLEYDPFKADIWSLGTTLYTIACGKSPWPAHALGRELETAITNGIIFYPNTIGLRYTKLLKKMIVVNPNKRATVEELLAYLDELYGSLEMKSSSIVELNRSMKHFGKLIIVSPCADTHHKSCQLFDPNKNNNIGDNTKLEPKARKRQKRISLANTHSVASFRHHSLSMVRHFSKIELEPQ